MIELHKLSKKIGDNLILDKIDLKLPNSGIVLIQGENGSGKTTLLNILSLLDDDYNGEFHYKNNNISILKDNVKSNIRHNEISYVFQKNNLIKYLSPENNLFLNDLIENKKSSKSKTSCNNKSQGEQEVIALKRSLQPGKKIYILDEAFASLDNNHQNEIIEIVKELSKIALVIIVSHDIDLSDIASFIYKIEHGILTEIKSTRDDSENVESDIDVKKLKFPLYLTYKRSFNNFVFRLCSIFLYALIISFACVGIIAYHGDSFSYLKEGCLKADYLSVIETSITNSESILSKFESSAYIQKDIGLYYSNKVENDGKIHCNSYSYSYYQGLRENQKYDMNYEFIIDDTIKDNHLFIYDKDNGVNSDNRKVLNFNDRNYWKVDKTSGYSYFKNHNYSFQWYMTLDIYNKMNKTTLDFTLDDDTFYISNLDFIVKQKTNFDYVPSMYTNDDEEYDFNKIFKDGVYVKYEQNIYSDTILVSNNTYDKLKQCIINYHTILVVLSQNKTSKLKYINNHSLKVTLPYSSQAINKYNSYLLTKCYKPGFYSYSIFIYIMPILLLVLETIITTSIKKLQSKNDYILRAFGISKLKLWLMDLIPTIITLGFSLLLGYCLALLIFKSSKSFYTLISTDLTFLFLWILVIVVLTILIHFYIYNIRKSR